MNHLLFGLLLLTTKAAPPRTVVLTLASASPTDGPAIRAALKGIAGVRGVGFEASSKEVTVRSEGVSDPSLVAALKRGGFKATVDSSKLVVGGPDILVITPDGAAVGPLEALRVKEKYTVFDVFAPWCEPCPIVDKELRLIVDKRADVAVRRLNLVSFESPLGTELNLDALPHMVVFAPSGKSVEIDGADLDALREALEGR